MKIKLYGLPINLLDSYYNVFDREKGLLQVLDIEDYCLYPISFTIIDIEVMKLMCRLSRLKHFSTMYLYNILFDSTSELYMENLEISFDLNIDKEYNFNVEDYDLLFQVKTPEPWLYPYDKILIPNLEELDFFMVDIEEISLSFLVVKKGLPYLDELHKTVLSVINKDETIRYIEQLDIGDLLKNKIKFHLSNYRQ